MEWKDKFISLIDIKKDDECWEWKGYKNPGGYGCFHIWGRKFLAHRVSLCNSTHKAEHFDNPKILALHSCDNPSCVNPNHLRWGDVVDNAKDMKERGRRLIRFKSH